MGSLVCRAWAVLPATCVMNPSLKAPRPSPETVVSAPKPPELPELPELPASSVPAPAPSASPFFRPSASLASACCSSDGEDEPGRVQVLYDDGGEES